MHSQEDVSVDPSSGKPPSSLKGLGEGQSRSLRRQLSDSLIDQVLKPIKSSDCNDVIMQLDLAGLRTDELRTVKVIYHAVHVKDTLPFIRVHESWIKRYFTTEQRQSCSLSIKHLPIMDSGDSNPMDMYHVVHEVITMQGRLPHGHHGIIAWKHQVKRLEFSGLIWILTSSSKLAQALKSY